MSQPPPGAPVNLLDTGNPLLAQGPARLDTGTVWQPGGGGQVGVITVRTPSSTQTVFLSPGDVKTWAKIIAALAESMSSSGLIVPGNGHIPPP